MCPIQVGEVKIGNFQQMSRCISEMVQDVDLIHIGVGSVVANHSNGGESSVVVTTIDRMTSSGGHVMDE